MNRQIRRGFGALSVIPIKIAVINKNLLSPPFIHKNNRFHFTYQQSNPHYPHKNGVIHIEIHKRL